MNRSRFRTTAALAAAFIVPPALAASQVVPRDPHEFDAVNLRLTVDSCAFAPETVAVSAAGGVIRVAHRSNNCLVAGEQRVVDIRLGTFPAGDWRVELHPDGNPEGPASEQFAFAVRARPQIAVFPPPPRPLTDYSGMWFRPEESGWGISIHQSSANVVFAGWYLYDLGSGKPSWLVILEGRWTSATSWTGTVFRAAGPPLVSVPVYGPARGTAAPVGEATLDFTQRPGEEGLATFTYTVDGIAGSRRITRLHY